MSFGLGHGRALDPSPGSVGISEAELGTLPDAIGRDPSAGWIDVRGWFATCHRPLEIEIGSGKGTFLVQEAARRPETNFLGIEWAGEFYRYGADRVRRHGLGNVRVLHGDATSFLRWRVASGVARVVHLYFPDPWPKARHHKKRTVRDDVLASIHRVLEPGGELRVVTDHDGYWSWMEAHFERWTVPEAWALLGGPPGSDGAPFERLAFQPVGSAGDEEMVGSNFERKYRREGRPFHAAVLRRG